MKRWRCLLLLALILLTGMLVLALEQFAAAQPAAPQLADLSEIALDGYERLLVLAPHDDDETLGAGGLILAALRQGIAVRVVIVTNGDGYMFATMDDFHKVFPTAQDYIHIGNQRQQESLQALQVLGLPAEQVSFLSYPDRGLPSLWESHWQPTEAYRSPYTGSSKSPYTITYDPEAVYAGQDLLGELRSIIETYQPDLIVYPHPNDVHPDHWALSAFTRLALALVQEDRPDYKPASYAYLIHRPDYPAPRGYHPTASLLPPPPLYALDSHWYRLDLSEEDIRLKQEAIRQYRTQLPVLGRLMESFVRQNELFSRLEVAELPTLAEGDPFDPSTWRTPKDELIRPVQRDPADDTLVRAALANADLAALYIARQPDQSLSICAETRGPIGTSLTLSHFVRIKAVASGGIVDFVAARHAGREPVKARAQGNYVCAQTSLPDIGQPDLLVVGAEVRAFGDGLIDQLAWQLVYLP